MKSRSNFSKHLSQRSRSLGASFKGSASKSLKKLKQAGSRVSKNISDISKKVSGARNANGTAEKKRKSFAERLKDAVPEMQPAVALAAEENIIPIEEKIEVSVVEVESNEIEASTDEPDVPMILPFYLSSKKEQNGGEGILKKVLSVFHRNHIKKEIARDEDLDIDVPPAIIPVLQKQTQQAGDENGQVVPQLTPVKLAPARVYADYASLTPVDPRVKKVMFEAMDMHEANPSSLYKRGVQAKKALEDARMSVAAFFSSNKNEIIFTSGGTESNNMVFRGVLKAFEEYEASLDEEKIKNKSNNGNRHADISPQPRPHFIISTIEHPSIIEIALDLINQGIDVSFIPVNSDGLIDPKDVRKALRPETILISIIYANNEIGTIQPLKEISREVRHFKKSLGRDNSDYPYIHSDACQAALYEDMRILSLNIDLMTIDGGKVYGPRGVGVLVKRRHVKLSSLFLGGNQENGFRPGTENLPAIIGLKHALDLAHSEREEESARLLELRETLLEMIMTKMQEKNPGLAINGSLEARLPNNLNICFPNIDAEFLVLRLDVLGVELSSVTSCRASNDDSSSYVIEALGRHDCAESSLRISLGRFTTAADIAVIAEKVCEGVMEQLEEGR